MLIILDRDGVINEDLPTGVRSCEEFRFIQGSVRAIAALCQAGHRIVIATNQANIGRGILSEQTLQDIHRLMCDTIAEAGGHISRIYVAPDATPSPRRKPEPGMLLEALHDTGYAASDTLLIGDALRDLEAAQKVGIEAWLVMTGKGAHTKPSLPPVLAGTRCVENLEAAAKLLLASAAKAD